MKTVSGVFLSGALLLALTLATHGRVSSARAAMAVRGVDYGEWSAPEMVDLVSQPGVGKTTPFESNTGLELYFGSGFDIWVSTRSGPNEGWDEAEKVASGSLGTPRVNTPSDEGSATLSADGLTMYFSSSRSPNCDESPVVPGVPRTRDIWIAHRNKPGELWRNVYHLNCDTEPGGVNSAAYDTEPMLFEDVLYFVSRRINASNPQGRYRIRSATLLPTSTPDRPLFAPSIEVAGLRIPNEAQGDRRPFVRHDGLEIVFASGRSSTCPGVPPGRTDTNLWSSTRSSRADTWPYPKELCLLNTLDSEGGPALSTDGMTLYFYSDRIVYRQVARRDGKTLFVPSGPKSDQLWMSRRPRTGY